MIVRAINDLKKYYKYSTYAAKADLKCEVANSHLYWMWWVLDPLLFMLVYSFISIVIFGKTTKYFAAFVFIGLSIWNFFNKCVINSVKIISSNRSIVAKVYLPKFILIITEMLELGFKMLISFSLVVIAMALYRVPLSPKIIYMLPILMTLCTITFGLSAIVAHFGVFFEDLKNILAVVLKFIFYLTGIFYEIIPLDGKKGRIAEPYATILSKLNPMAFLINSSRQCMLYEITPARKLILAWFCVGVLLSAIGLWLIYKYENTYVKVI